MLTDLGRSLDVPLATMAEWVERNWQGVKAARGRWDRLRRWTLSVLAELLEGGRRYQERERTSTRRLPGPARSRKRGMADRHCSAVVDSVWPLSDSPVMACRLQGLPDQRSW